MLRTDDLRLLWFWAEETIRGVEDAAPVKGLSRPCGVTKAEEDLDHHNVLSTLTSIIETNYADNSL